MTVPPEAILGTHVLATYIAGRAVFEKSKMTAAVCAAVI